jgi:hypothetical protein
MGPGSLALEGPSGDSREDRDDVTRPHCCVQPVQIADVVVVQIDVDELVERAVIGEELADEAWMRDLEGTKHLADGRAIHRGRRRAVGGSTKQRRQLHFYRHRTSGALDGLNDLGDSLK